MKTHKIILTTILLLVVVTTFINPITGQVEEGEDGSTIEIHINEDNEAVFTVEQRTELTTESEENAFEEIIRDIEENEQQYITDFEERLSPTVNSAQETTGREMELQNTSVNAQITEVTNTYGVITYETTWDGMVVEEDEGVIIGDAIAGFYLDESSQLIISWNERYELSEVTPEPDSESATMVNWNGEKNFASSEPSVELQTVEDESSSGVSIESILVLVGSVIAIGFFGYIIKRRMSKKEPTEASNETTAESSEEIKTKNDEVMKILEDNDGKMKQKEITEEVDWSKATVSRIVQELEENEEVDTFRVGREKIVEIEE